MATVRKSIVKTPRKKVNDTVLIRKANDLVEARYKFDIWETRLFIKMLTMIRSDDKDFNEYKIYINELVKDFKLESNKDIYRRVKEGARKLMTKIIKVMVKDDGNMVELETPIIGAVKRTLEEGDGSYIKLAFYPDMKPFLLELKNRYLVYDFNNVSNLPSPYYIRLYELLKQYEKIGQRRFDVQELKEMLGITTEYKLYGHFKEKILDKAQVKLLEHTDISFTFEEVKQGRAVTELLFKIRKNKPLRQQEAAKNRQMQMDLEDLDNDETAEYEELDSQPLVNSKNKTSKIVVSPVVAQYFERLNDWWGVSKDAFIKKAVDKTGEDVERAIEFTKQRIKLGKAENPAGVFLEALMKGYRTTQQHKTEKAAEKQADLERQMRDIQARLTPLVARYELLADEYAAAINAVIRDLTRENPDITEGVIERLKENYLRMGDKTLVDKSIEDFRKNPFLRGLVKTEIIKDNPVRFGELNEVYDDEMRELMDKIKGIDPNYKF